jgi:hypothetical protein
MVRDARGFLQRVISAGWCGLIRSLGIHADVAEWQTQRT